MRHVTERMRIRVHLARVEADLRRADTTGLTDTQRERRERSLDALGAYWRRGVFPRNEDVPGRRNPVFVDRDGRRCAVAELLTVDGRQGLVGSVVAVHNLDLVEDMRVDDLARWAEENGFAVSELARVQPAYCFQRPGAECHDVGGGSWMPSPVPPPVASSGIDLEVWMVVVLVAFASIGLFTVARLAALWTLARLRALRRSAELGETDGVGTRTAGPAPEGVVDDDGFGRVAVELEDVGTGLEVVGADAASAEPARADGAAVAVPAVHPIAPTGRG